MSLQGNATTDIPLLHAALDKGINYFDTADMYEKGDNEVLVGKAFKESRSKVILGTKVGNQWRPDGSGWDWNPTKVYILKSVEESLQRLQTDYIDLYQLHGGTINDPIDETIEAFEILKQQGKIRYYGISSIRPNVIREYVERSGIVSVMMQHSLLDRRPEESCLSLLRDHNIGVLARGVLAKGLLINKDATPYLDHTLEIVKRTSGTIDSLTSQDRSKTSVAISYVLQNPAITSVVIGIRNKEQLHDSLEAVSSSPLDPHEIELLQHSIPQNNYTEHR